MEETKRRQIRIEAGERAIKYENRILERGYALLKEFLRERLRDIDSRMGKQRINYLQRNGYSKEGMEYKRAAALNVAK